MNSFERRRHFYNRCKPDQPLQADDNWYVDFDGLGLRGERCRSALQSVIEFSDAPTCQLFTGFSGSGKTSELLRLVRELERSNHLVVFSDSLDSIDLLNDVEYSDLLIHLGLACDERLVAAIGQGKGKKWARRFGTELREILFSDVALQQFNMKVPAIPGPELGLEIKENISFRKAMRNAANNRRRQLLDQVREFFAAADRAAVEAGFDNGLVIIMDNLEKLSSQKEVLGSAVDMFLHHRDALRAPDVHIIYTLPAAIVFSAMGPKLGRLYDGEPVVLPMVKVRDRVTGEAHSEGFAALHEMLGRRLDMEEVFGSDKGPVELLIESCGGYPRDLLRLVQYSIQSADCLPVGEAAIRAAITKIRKSFLRGYNDSYQSLLEHVREHRPQTIPVDLYARLEEAVINHFIMVYGNDTEWYDVHPIVRGVLADL